MLIAGDGAMQQTASELGTMLGLSETGARGRSPCLDNDGYTAERAIHRPDAGYQLHPGLGLDRAARPP